jgi:poly(beta-D-mannuronate) lyase
MTQATVKEITKAGKKINMNKILFSMLLVIASQTAIADTVTVASLEELQGAISKAKAGDVILVKDGVYVTSSQIDINCAGTKEHPVVIAAKNFGAAEITGNGGFNLVAPAAYIIIRDFKFTHSASKAKSSSGSTFCRWTNNIFETPGDGENLTIAGNDTEVDHNTFCNKNAMGRFLAIRGAGKQIAERLWIHHNYFKSHKDQGGKNGAEAFQFGLSGFSMSSSNSIVEYNLFEDCAGENELISIKTSAVTLRYNTIRDCPAQFTLRHGNKCQVYGNYFFNTPGLRIFGDDHVIHSNYFENCSPAINVGNGDGEVADGAQLTAHDRPDRVLIAFNTLINNKTNITQSGRKEGMGATYITIANNIIQGGGPAASISGPYTNGTWEGNIIFNTNGAGDMPSGSYQILDPKLVKDATGIFHLKKESPAVNAGKGNYSSAATDMDGQKRTSPFDTGADEVFATPVISGVLNPADVGAARIPKRSK